MDYENFSDVLNKAVFSDSKVRLLRSIANSPNIYIGLFRPTKPAVKIAQNISQSHEIKFGYAFENLIRQYLSDSGCKMLPNNLTIDGEQKELDIHFRKDNEIFVVEQKIRDNHDSTKKKGQIDDFEKKLLFVSKNEKQKIHGILFFVDPGMSDNKPFYERELKRIDAEHGIKTHLLYGSQFFDTLSLGGIWSEIESHLTQWRTDLPGFPKFNYDENPEDSFNQINDLSRAELRKLFENEEIGKHILPIIFPKGRTLTLLANHCLSKGESYNNVLLLIKQRIDEIKKVQIKSNA